jgi:GntR family transcriptional regulator / MocR family aminotransferase
MSTARKIELAEWARSTGAYLIEDAWDSDYRYGGTVAPCLQSYCPDKVLYLYTPFKVLYPLTMIGFLIVPRALIPAFTKLKLITERHMPSLDALVLTDFISEGHFDKHIDGVLKVYRHRRQSLIFALKTCFREQIVVFPKTAGLHLRFQLSVQADDSAIMALANRLAIPLVSTSQYYLGDPPGGEFLMQFSLEAPETLIPRIAAFAELLNL